MRGYIGQRFLGFFLVLGMALLGLALAMTPAGTGIQNQASASYIDSAGQPRTTTSNLVVTVVQQVYAFTIAPDGTEASPGQTRQGLPGSQVLFNYTVTNNGNGTDTILLSTAQGGQDGFDLSNVQIFLDVNCNGNLDAGESTPITSVTLGMGQSACVIVRATIPTTAQNGQYGNLNLVGTSQGDPSVTDNNNWARAVATTAAALTAFKSASPTGTVQPGDIITYTISGSNTGGSPASGVSIALDGNSATGILVADVIPSGLEVSGMPTGTAGAGTVVFVYSTDGSTWQTLQASNLPLTGNGTIAIGMFIQGTGAFFPQGAQYTFTFQAEVPNVPSGTTYQNAATVRFNDGTQDQTATTNTTQNTVGASYNVAVGPWNYPTGNAPAGTYTAGQYTVTRSGDTQTIAQAYSGTEVIFRHTLRNTGNAQDTFTLTVSGQPEGWVCQLVANDLTTPISGPVGPVAAGADYDFALRCPIPAGYTSATPVSLTVTATSQGNPSQSDTTTDTVSAVASGYRHDLYGGVNGNPPYTQSRTPDGTNDTSAELSSDPRPPIYQSGTTFPSANPGGAVVYRLRVENLGANPDNYNLVLTPQTGYAGRVQSVVFYPDANDDGVADGPAITATGLLNPGQTFNYIAVVTLSPTAPPGSAGFNFEAHSTQVPPAAQYYLDYAYTQVEVNTLAQISLDPDRAGTVTSPGTIEYTHTLLNNSNAPAYCNISGNGGQYGWTYLYSTDGTSWFAALYPVSVAPNGGTQTIYVRVIVPAGEPIGRVDVNTTAAGCWITADPFDPQNPTGAQASDTATETTTVVGGDLRLIKSAVSYVGSSNTVRSSDGSQAYPGDQIEYTVVAENIGTANLTKVILADPIPAYTDLVPNSISLTLTGFSGTVLYSTDGATWSTTPPSNLSAGQSLFVAVDTNGDSQVTDADTMPPGARITLTFKVQVQ